MNYEIVDDLSIRIVGDELFILKRSMSMIHSFNATGTMIWKMLQEKKQIEEIARAISERFDISKNEAEKDVSEFLYSLIKNQLVTLHE
jgi:hypothetical protein